MAEKRIPPNTVQFYIEGPKITADDFRRCVRNFLDLLNEVTIDVSGRKKAVEWIISVAPGSIGLLATPRPQTVTPRWADALLIRLETAYHR